MQNKVIVCSDQLEVEKVLCDVEKFFISRGYFDFTYISCSAYEEGIDIIKHLKENTEIFIVICDNSKIDGLIEQIKLEGDEFELINQQAVILKNAQQKILFLPIELPVEKFLENFEQKNVYVCSIFGKSLSYIKTNFENFKNKFDLSYKIITKGGFLYTVYYSKEVDDSVLKNVFGDGLFSYKDETLASACKKVCEQKSIYVLDNVTSGGFTERLLNENFNIKSSKILVNQSEFSKLGISEDFIAEKGFVSKETAFELAKNVIKNDECDIVVVVLGNVNDLGKNFVAVGNKDVIHVFSSVFEGEKKCVIENIIDFALYRLLRFF